MARPAACRLAAFAALGVACVGWLRSLALFVRPPLLDAGAGRASVAAPRRSTAAVAEPTTSAAGAWSRVASTNDAPKEVPAIFQGNDICRLRYAQQEGIGKKSGPVPKANDAGGAASDKVLFSVYDLTDAVPAEELEKWLGSCERPPQGIWHSSLAAFGHTYDNPRHVDGQLPHALSPFVRYQYELPTKRKLEEWKDFFSNISAKDQWAPDKYDLRRNNCNHFMVDCLQYLVGPGQESYVISSPQFLSPWDFSKRAPTPELGQQFNKAIMGSMLQRQREARRKMRAYRKAKAEDERKAGIAVGLIAVATVAWQVYSSGYQPV